MYWLDAVRARGNRGDVECRCAEGGCPVVESDQLMAAFTCEQLFLDGGPWYVLDPTGQPITTTGHDS